MIGSVVFPNEIALTSVLSQTQDLKFREKYFRKNVNLLVSAQISEVTRCVPKLIEGPKYCGVIHTSDNSQLIRRSVVPPQIEFTSRLQVLKRSGKLIDYYKFLSNQYFSGLASNSKMMNFFSKQTLSEIRDLLSYEKGLVAFSQDSLRDSPLDCLSMITDIRDLFGVEFGTYFEITIYENVARLANGGLLCSSKQVCLPVYLESVVEILYEKPNLRLFFSEVKDFCFQQISPFVNCETHIEFVANQVRVMKLSAFKASAQKDNSEICVKFPYLKFEVLVVSPDELYVHATFGTDVLFRMFVSHPGDIEVDQIFEDIFQYILKNNYSNHSEIFCDWNLPDFTPAKSYHVSFSEDDGDVHQDLFDASQPYRRRILSNENFDLFLLAPSYWMANRVPYLIASNRFLYSISDDFLVLTYNEFGDDQYDAHRQDIAFLAFLIQDYFADYLKLEERILSWRLKYHIVIFARYVSHVNLFRDLGGQLED